VTDQTYLPWRAWWAMLFIAVVMGLILLMGSSQTLELQPRAFIFDYPWKLPDPTWFSRALVWTLYGCHQIGIWYLIHKAQSQQLSYARGLHSVNVQALLLNAVFVLLHIGQTRWTYDGLAQDVPEITALASVALMLFVIIIMENDRRGMFFGKRVPLPEQLGPMLRRYHGYYFAWAITYTFWYHPMATTPGHLMGFFYMLMLFVQGSLFMTRAHVNRWWTVTLEFFMVIHGATVAWLSLNGMAGPHWSQFLFAGLAIFIITQMPGLTLKRWQRWAIVMATFATASVYYAMNLERLWELPRVLGQRYGMILALAMLIWFAIWPFLRWKKKVEEKTG
jgi:hypothetical protein